MTKNVGYLTFVTEPFPTIARLIRLAQYSLLHHSMSLRRVSLPTMPPSASLSLFAELTDGAGDATRDGMGDGSKVLLGVSERDARALSPSSACFSFSDLAAAVNVALFPVPNLLQACPRFVRCLFSWNIRHMSAW